MAARGILDQASGYLIAFGAGAFLASEASGFGLLRAVRHSARLSSTPAAWMRPSQPPGSAAPRW